MYKPRVWHIARRKTDEEAQSQKGRAKTGSNVAVDGSEEDGPSSTTARDRRREGGKR
jgi:hypothetical protein